MQDTEQSENQDKRNAAKSSGVTSLDRIAPPSSRWPIRSCGRRRPPSTPTAVPARRVLHPIWEWDGTDLFGWIATVPSPVKKAHLAVHPQMSLNYWAPSHDTCSAECLVEWYPDDETRKAVWDKFANGPEPVGYDPTIVPQWIDGPTSDDSPRCG